MSDEVQKPVDSDSNSDKPDNSIDSVKNMPKEAEPVAELAEPIPQESAKPAEVKQAAAKPTAAKPEVQAPVVKPTAAKPVAQAAAKPAPGAKPTAAAKKPPAPPDPRVEAAKAEAEKIKAVLIKELGDDVVESAGAAHVKPMVLVKKEKWRDAVDLLRTHPDYLLNYVECMAGTDYPAYIEVVIFVQSTNKGHFVCLKTRTDKESSSIPSITPIYPGVNWEEREIFDLLGVSFTDHPDLRRIMMPDDFTGHPLRKDFSPWD